MRLCDQILYRLLEMLEMINMHDIGAIICVCVVVRTTAERCRVKEIMFFIYRLRQPVGTVSSFDRDRCSKMLEAIVRNQHISNEKWNGLWSPIIIKIDN